MIKILRQLYSTAKKKHLLKKEFNKRYPTCSFEEGLVIKGPLSNLSLENNVIIQSNVMIHLGGMEWCQNEGSLQIGKNSIISPNVIIYAAGSGGITIGENFDCGPSVKIFASHTNFNDRTQRVFGQVEIGNNVILFANVVVSPGIKIGDNAIVLASSVVTKDIPPNTIFGGVPAKFIKEIK